MIANVVVSFFLKGGPIMWPILVCMVVAVAVVGERMFWWWNLSRKRDHEALMKVMDALQKGDLNGASALHQELELTFTQTKAHLLPLRDQ